MVLLCGTFLNYTNFVSAETVNPSTMQGGNAPNSQTIQGQGPGELQNPLGSNNKTIPDFLLKVIDILLVFLTPIIILYIMYAGFLFVTARGNTEQISTARSALLWAIVGGVIVLGAKIIISVIEGTVKGLGA